MNYRLRGPSWKGQSPEEYRIRQAAERGYLGDVSSGGSFLSPTTRSTFLGPSWEGASPEKYRTRQAEEAATRFEVGVPLDVKHTSLTDTAYASQLPHAMEFAGSTPEVYAKRRVGPESWAQNEKPPSSDEWLFANQYAGTPPAAAAQAPAAASTPSDAQVQGMMKMAGLLSPPQDDKPPTMTAPGVIPGKAPFAGQDFQLGAGRKRQYFVPQGFLR